LRDELYLRVFENRMLRRIFRPKRDVITGMWRKLRNEELRDNSPNIIPMIILRRMSWGEHVTSMGCRRVLYRVLVGKPERKRPLERPMLRWND